MKQTIVFDFDGVIHRYSSGWQGITNIPDEPVDGIHELLKSLHEANYEIIIVSTRCQSDEGAFAIESWLHKWHLDTYVDRVCKEKPPALVYIDDRAICFDGNPKTLLDKIKSFEPWYEREYLSMDFGKALYALKAGHKVRRRGWNGKGIYLELQVPDEHSKMTLPYIYIVTTQLVTDNPEAPKGVVPWLASQTDMLAEDWEVFD